MDDRPVLPLALDTATRDAYERMAAMQGTDSATLIQRLLAGIAPVVAEAASQAQRQAEGGLAHDVQLYARLVRGCILVGREVRCVLLTQAGEGS